MGVKAGIWRRQSTCHPQEDLLVGASTPRSPPRTALKSPPSYCRRLLHLSCPGTSASSSINLASCFTPPPRESRTLMCDSFYIYLLFFWFFFASSSPCFSCCRVTAPTSLQTFTYRGPSGCLRGQRLALDSYCRPCYFNLVHIEVLVLLSCPTKTLQGVEYEMSINLNVFFFFCYCKFPFQTEDLDFYLMSIL